MVQQIYLYSDRYIFMLFIIGKGESIWDHLTHTTPEAVADRSNGDIAADSYRLYKDDVKALTQIGVNTFCFTLESF